jgi:hypothetical protein
MQNTFPPPRRTGVMVHVFLILLSAGVGGWFFIKATRDASGLDFLLDMLVALVVLAPLPILLYRFYGLLSGSYTLQRDGLAVRWGFRREDVPLQAIEWIRPAKELGFHLPLPWLRWPGGIVGRRQTTELGEVEFMAADTAHMLLVATPDRIIAVSPKAVADFMALFRRVNELGSLSPLPSQSVYPRILLGRVWENVLSRLLLLVGLGVGLVVLTVVGFALPGRETIAWGAEGILAPAERLLLLPVLNGMIWFGNMVLGLFLFRLGGDRQFAAQFLWGSSILAGLLLLTGSLILIF